MKLLPRLPELAGQRDLSPEEKSELWRRICRESPMSVFWLAVSMVVSYEAALSAADDFFQIHRSFGSMGTVAFMIAAMGAWAWTASWVTMHFLYFPRLKKAVARISRNDGRFDRTR
ncbi:MAG: hypothetical protein JWO82_846 [Akkermansiaceae bacterium]|nr:hypothetical protein [Akkermansiaceae bacterium]